MPETLAQNIKTFIAERYQTKLEEKQKAYDKNKAAAVTAEDFDRIESQFLADKEKLLQQFELNAWIDNAARRATKVAVATHVAKFTHSSSKATSFYVENGHTDLRYLDSSCLESSINDIAVSDAKASPTGKLLLIEDKKQTPLWQYILNNDPTPFSYLIDDSNLITTWYSLLKEAIEPSQPTSHIFNKQIYFPISDNKYHLLAPLYSSSLAQALFDEIQYSRFSQEMEAIRKAKRNNDVHPDPLVDYPNLAMTIAGGSNKQNVSQLNSKRMGLTYLFSAAPPHWQTQIKAPIGLDSILRHREIHFHTKAPIARLTQLLIKLNATSTDSNMHIRDYIANTVDEVIDQILLVVMPWQQLPAGWSNASALPLAQRRWLDPNNTQWDKFDDDWQQAVAANVGLWLKDKINKGSQNQFTLGQIDAEQWQKQCLQALKDIA
ncbi:TPA: type I-F CRISPR-associated protein Csy1 [Photobacterium damselae]